MSYSPQTPRRVLTAAFSLLVLVGLGACDRLTGDAADKPAEQATPDAKADATPDAKADATPAESDAKVADTRMKEPPLPSAEELATQRAALLAALNEGRKLVKAKDYAAGIAKYEEALKINPAHGTTLSELGWALFLKGDHERAEKALRDALHHVHAPKTRGALLYNLGRALEELKQPEEAARAYKDSLELRPNKVVQKRLATLEAATDSAEQAAAVQAAELKRCAFKRWEGVAPARLCEAYLAEELKGPEAGRYECNEEDLVALEIAVAAGEENPTETMETKRTLEVDSTTRATTFDFKDYEYMMETQVLVIEMGPKWFSFDFAHPSHPGVGGVDEYVTDIKLEARQLVPGGRPELLFHWTYAGHDSDMEVNEMESFDNDYVGVISLEGEAPTWLAVVHLKQSFEVSELLDEPEMEFEHSENFGSKTEKAVRVNWLAETGELEVTRSGKDGALGPLGTFKLGDYPKRCGPTWE